jgi:predicted aspartyl protease
VRSPGNAIAAARTLAVVCAVVCAFALAAPGCALPAWLRRPPVFPGGQAVWEVPLYEPLTRLGPHVLGTVSGRGAAGREQVLFYVDSGSSHCALEAATFARLGVGVEGSRFATITDASGQKRSWSSALVPEVRLDGGLALADVVASVEDRQAILGANVIAAHGWQLDLDRGTLSLGAAPWPPAPDVVVVPTQSYGMHAIADVRVAGQVVPLLVDTGAPFTVVDAAILRGLGLPEKPLASRWPLGGGARSESVSSFFEAPVALGALGELALGPRRIYAHPGGMSPGRGMLGNDVLFAYAVQVTAAGMKLRPRAPSVADATGARLARWRDLPSCPEAPACAAAELVPAEGTSDARPHVRLRLLAAVPPRPFRYLYGCSDGSGTLRRSPLWIEVAVAQPSPGSAVEIPVAPDAPAAFARMWAQGCRALVLLDANPVVDAHPLSGAAEARVTAETRRMIFN